MVLSRNKRSSTTDDLDCDQGGKRQKGVKDANRDSSRQSGKLVDDEGNVFWKLADRRRVTITTFRKETKINIREYYEQDGKMLPGKKGIALSLDQFHSLLDLLPDIVGVLHERGHSIALPRSRDSPSPSVVDKSDEEREPATILEDSADLDEKAAD